MNIKSILTSNWFGCSVLTLIMMVGITAEAPLLQRLENSAYDMLSPLHKVDNNEQVVLIAIDQESIGRVGGWPWPRSVIAEAITQLAKHQVQTIGLNLLYPDREITPGVRELNRLKESLSKTIISLPKKSRRQLENNFSAAEKRLDYDSKLVRSVKSAGNVIVPLQFFFSTREWNDSGKNNGWLKDFSIEYPKETRSIGQTFFDFGNPLHPDLQPHAATGFSSPFRELVNGASGIGHDTFIPDRDGTVRSSNLFISWQDKLYPSMALRISMSATGTKLSEIGGVYSKDSISALTVDNLTIPTGNDYRMLMAGNGSRNSYKTYPFHAIYDGKIDKEQLGNRVALIGLTAPGLSRSFKTGDGNEISHSELTAAATAAIMSGSHLSRPGWTWILEIGALLYFGLFLSLIIPRVNISLGVTILVIFIFSWQALSILLFISQGIWIKSASATLLAVLGLGHIIFIRTFFNPQDRSSDIESNKVLGLSFQSQGMLDLALEKFMKCPVSDPSVKELLYNLGLDMERKRMHNKAKAVYEHIYSKGSFKDVQERIERLQSTARLPSFPKQDNTALSMTTADAKPTLGRYEILKELGQGAIGTVYLGRDPKINREVAIKTLRYDQIEIGDLDEVKERFFREAEAAGRLNHPSIVTIYDIGEDHDMTYMAMELLDGNDLSQYCKMGNLLPVSTVLEVIVRVAEALEYAHRHHVVHRDIKPANIIMLKDGHVKVADFGIARILDSSKTQTGVILGTPNYMSPEQVAGKKVDGSSDQFSLGVVFYELLTGIKPFKNPNIAALMHSISTVKYTPLQEIDPGIPECCVNLAVKLMAKAKSRRFDSTESVIAEAKKCLREFR